MAISKKNLIKKSDSIRDDMRIIRDHFYIDQFPAEKYQKLQEKDDVITDILNNFNSLPVGR